jgi:hypothetical protein
MINELFEPASVDCSSDYKERNLPYSNLYDGVITCSSLYPLIIV